MQLSARPLTALAAALALALAGCGGGTRTVTVTESTAANANTGSTATTTGAPARTASTQTASTPSEAPTTIVHLGSFQSPSGNIGCMLIAGIARCDIAKRSWPPPARPASCPDIVDFGQGLEVGHAGAAGFVCAGDTARDPASPRLAYGSGSQVGDFVCVSRTSGITCSNRFSGHGFFVSIEGYRLF